MEYRVTHFDDMNGELAESERRSLKPWRGYRIVTVYREHTIRPYLRHLSRHVTPGQE